MDAVVTFPAHTHAHIIELTKHSNTIASSYYVHKAIYLDCVHCTYVLYVYAPSPTYGRSLILTTGMANATVYVCMCVYSATTTYVCVCGTEEYL